MTVEQVTDGSDGLGMAGGTMKATGRRTGL